MIEVLYLFIFQSFHFHPTKFVCYFAIKWSIFDLNGRFFDENMIEFNGEHVGMIIFGIQSCLARIVIFTPVFGYIYTQNLLRQENTMKEANVSFPVIDPPSLCIYKGCINGRLRSESI